MKVLIINKFLYPKGGDAISAIETGRLLLKKGHKVVYWGMAHPDNPEYRYSKYFVPFVDLNKNYKLTENIKIAFNMLYSFPAKKGLKEVLKKFKPDIVHLHNIAHQISPSIIDLLKSINIPCVMTMHDYKLTCASYRLLTNDGICEKCKNRKFYNCLLNKCIKNSYAKSLLNTIEMYLHHFVLDNYGYIKIFVSPSKFLKKKLKELGFRGRINYLPNFVNLHYYKPKYDYENNNFIYFGRFSEEKGLDTLVDVFSKKPGISLKLIGDGNLKEMLSDRIRKNNLKNINIVDYMEPEKLRNEIQKAFCVILPSKWYENNPLSIIESFALGKPVIGSAIGGIPELVRNFRTGLTFKTNNIEDLSFKVEYAASHPDIMKMLGINARKLVEEEFNPDNHYSGLMKIYEEAID